MLRFRDILVRIRIRGSVPLVNGSGSGCCYFHQWPSRRQKKISSDFFCLLLVQGTFTYFSKRKVIKKSIRSHKTVEIKIFLLFLLEGFGSGPATLLKNIFYLVCRNRSFGKQIYRRYRQIRIQSNLVWLSVTDLARLLDRQRTSC